MQSLLLIAVRLAMVTTSKKSVYTILVNLKTAHNALLSMQNAFNTGWALVLKQLTVLLCSWVKPDWLLCLLRRTALRNQNQKQKLKSVLKNVLKKKKLKKAAAAEAAAAPAEEAPAEAPAEEASAE